MKHPLSLAAMTFCIGLAAVSGLALPSRLDSDNANRIKDRFTGAWRLVSLEEPDSNGEIHKADCTGLLVYTRDGHMSVQVMYRNPQTGGPAGPVQYAQGGYEASFGRYKVDEQTQTFTFHVEGAMVRSLVGKDLPRAFEFSGHRMVVKSTDPNEHWRVTWEHY